MINRNEPMHLLLILAGFNSAENTEQAQTIYDVKNRFHNDTRSTLTVSFCSPVMHSSVKKGRGGGPASNRNGG